MLPPVAKPLSCGVGWRLEEKVGGKKRARLSPEGTRNVVDQEPMCPIASLSWGDRREREEGHPIEGTTGGTGHQ